MEKITATFLFVFFHIIQLIGQSSIYLYTEKNILPDEDIKVQLSGFNISSKRVEFEIYRIKEPLKLITSKYDLLSFSIEAFNDLIENFEFVSSRAEKIDSDKSWFVKNFNLGSITKKGSYIILAKLNDQISIAFFSCSEIGIISKRSTNQILVYLSNRKSSQPLSKRTIKLVSIDKRVITLITNSKGIAKKNIGNRPEDTRMFLLTEDNDTTTISEILYSPSDEYNRYLVYTYTNQPVYRPGQKVHFKSIIRKREGDLLQTLKDFNVRVKISSQDNSTFLDSIFITNKFGSINGTLELPDDTPLGEYSIILEINGMNYPSVFFVEEYKKPEYKVEINTDKKNYTYSEKVNISISANYFFGKPLLTGKVKLLLYRKPLKKFWWEFEPFAEFYRGCFIDVIPFHQWEMILEENGELENGTFKFNYSPEKELDNNYEYQIVALVKDETNREVQGSKNFVITTKKISITTQPDRYFYSPNSTILLKVVTTDFSFKPIQKDFTIIIQKVYSLNYSEYYENIDTLYGKTHSDGIAIVKYKQNESGRYSYLVIVEDEGEKSIARNNFIISDKEIKISGIREGIQIIPAKDVFEDSDELEFLLLSSVNDVNVFVSLEQSKVYGYKVLKLNGNSAIIKFSRIIPSVTHIFAGFYFENQFFSTLKKFGVLKTSQKLNIEIYSDKEIYKPGEKGKFKIKVTDLSGKPMKDAELSSSIIDESIFSIKPEQSKNIYEVFSESSIYKILTTTTELNKILYNQYYFNTEPITFQNLIQTGNCKATGLILNAQNLQPIQNVGIKLIKDNMQRSTLTDANGIFRFENLPEGTFDLIIEHPEFYNTIIKSIKLNENSTYDFGEIQLYPIHTTDRPFYSADFLRKKDLSMTIETGIIKPLSEIERTQKFPEPEIRKEFKDAVFWNGNLMTNQNGELEIEVKFPDNLTMWRNSIKVITQDSRSGEIFKNVIVRKNILVRIESPRYIHENDEINLPLLVHNYSRKKQSIRIQIEVINGKILDDKNERLNQRILQLDKIEIDPEDIFKLKIRVKVDQNVDTLILIAKALNLNPDNLENESDAVEIKIPVDPLGISTYEITNFSLSKDIDRSSYNLLINQEKKNFKVTLKVSPTLLGSILSSIDELVGYPYGCVEQTMSRFLPSIIVVNLIKELNLNISRKTLDELPSIIKSGLNRLKDFQHSDGGWGWWKDDQTNPYMTAYVMYGLSLTKKAGYEVEEQMFYNGLMALRNLLTKNQNDELTETYLLYSFNESISMSKNAEPYRNLIEKKFLEYKYKAVNPFSIALLLEMAIKNGYEEEIKELKQKLISSAIIDGNIVLWGKETSYGQLSNDKIELTANAIRALILSGENSEFIENAIRWVLNQKRGNLWLSTKQTASVIFSLAEYIKQTQELDADFTLRITLNGKEIKSLKFDKTNYSFGEISLDLSSHLSKSDKYLIEIEKVGKGKAYCQLIEKYFIPKEERDNSHFEVERKFYTLTFQKDGEKLMKRISPFNNQVKVGELILVMLKVKSKIPIEYFMIEDPMVPGFERVDEFIIDRNFYVSIYNHKEERDKKTAFFVSYSNAEEFTFSYVVYAQLPGKFTVPPTQASFMYYPDISSHGDKNAITIVE